MKIVVASESPYRKRALDMLGLVYEVCPSRVDEKTIRDDDAAEFTRKLAEVKARKVASEHPDAVVVSGDAVMKSRAAWRKRRNSYENCPGANSSL